MIYLIFSIILFLITLFFFIVVCKRKSLYTKYVSKIVSQIENFGNVFTVNGEIGKGKTSFFSGIINSNIEFNLIPKLYQRIDEARLKINFIDFSIVNELIYEHIDLEYPLLEKKVMDLIIDLYPRLDSFSYDFLSIKEYYEILRQYIKAYYVLNIRNDYVKSSTSFYCIPTRQYAKIFNPHSLEMVNTLSSKDNVLDEYTIIFVDENTLFKNNSMSNLKETKNNGYSLTLQLLRNAYKGTAYHYSIYQDWKMGVSSERRLTQNAVFIKSMDLTNNYSLVQVLFKFISKIIYSPLICFYIILGLKNPFKIKSYVYQKLDNFKNKKSFIKNIESTIYSFNEFLNSFGYLKFCIDVFSINEDKKDLLYSDVVVMPALYCWGSFNTYEYYYISRLYQYLKENSLNNSVSPNVFKEQAMLFIKTLKERGVFKNE